MQQIEQELDVQVPPAPTEPISESFHLTPEEADEIFKLAEAEIQPLLRQAAQEKWTGRVQAAFCLCMMLTGLIGTIWQVINYPKTIVTLFPVERPVTITTSLDVSLRTLAPVTITRSATTQATGKGHQNARAASGSLLFYNGLFSPQYIPLGTVFTGSDGVKVSTDENVTIPAANPPQFAETMIPAHTIETGAVGNIRAGDINTTVSNGVLVKNTQFTGGRDARDYKAVAQSDIQGLTASTTQIVTQQIPQAFSLRPSEALKITDCTTKTTADHAPGEEAQTVTVKTVKTCAAVAYNAHELDNKATRAFTKARPVGYQLIGNVQTDLTSVTPFQVKMSGTWEYVISSDYEQYLAEQIAGDTPAKAKAYLLKTGVIAQASIATTLPQEMYIKFVVIVGM